MARLEQIHNLEPETLEKKIKAGRQLAKAESRGF